MMIPLTHHHYVPPFPQVGLWGSAITPQASSATYCDPSMSTLQNALAYYKADRGEGITLIDAKGDKHGELVGGVAWVQVGNLSTYSSVKVYMHSVTTTGNNWL